MGVMTRLRLWASVMLVCSCSAPESSAPQPPPRAAAPVSEMTPVAVAIALGAAPLAIDRDGIPRLVRATPAMPPAIARDPVAAAREHVARLAPAWRVASGALPVLESAGEIPVRGGTIVRLRQVIDGIPVDAGSGGELRVLVQDGALIAASGALIGSDAPRDRDAAAAFVDDEAGAVARAVGAVHGARLSAATLATRTLAADGSRLFAGGDPQIHVALARARKAWHRTGDALVAAWIVEAYSSDAASTHGGAHRTVISADGRVLAQTDLQARAGFRYRVFAEATGERHPFDGPIADVTPHPVGSPGTVAFPSYVAPNLVLVDGLDHPADSASPDPWLLPGATETSGNNVDAYTDFTAPDGFTSGDFRATLTSPASDDAAPAFDRSYDTSLGPLSSGDQQMSAITSLFYLVNWLHDFWYDAGFTEVAGNAQRSNFGRGGEDNDAIHAEAEDSALAGARDNADMTTPADGLPPRMQIQIWDGKQEQSLAVADRTPATGAAAFGPTSFDATAEVVLANDGSTATPSGGPGGTTSDACQPLPAAVAGKIVLVDRGICSYKAKALAVQSAGGLAMILADNATDIDPPDMPDDATLGQTIAIGALSVLRSEGAAIRNDLAHGPVAATLHRKIAPDLDAALDATIVAHEFMHYVHHRLSTCNTVLCGAMSEGWADFDALLVMARAGDNLDGAFPIGVYATQSLPGDPVYFGIRRAPYSTNPSINALAFHHMADDQDLPDTMPLAGGGPNSEVHNAGEIWAAMLWDGYVALQKAGAAAGVGFDDVRQRMQQYVVAGLLLAPTDATPTEARDAILTAVRAASPADHDVLAAAYAGRGFGTCAVSPPRDSEDFVGIVDSAEVKGRIVPGAVSSQITASCDADDLLDTGETARITVPITNVGAAPLTDVAVALNTTTPGVHILAPTVSLGSIEPYSTASAAFDVELDDSVTTALDGELRAQITATGACETSVDVPFAMLLNADEIAASAAVDTFDARSSVWTATGDPLWTHARKTVLDGIWSGADASVRSDASLVSPPLTAGTDPVVATVTHRFSFELTSTAPGFPAAPFDGGVIEYSTDGGATWKDVSAIAAPGYNRTLTAGSSANPLAGRRAYGGTSPGYPQTFTLQLDFGTRLSGMTFQLRLRIGTDGDTGAPGWEIDSIAMTGLTTTPFPSVIANTGHCNTGSDAGAPSPDAGDAGDPNDAGVPADADEPAGGGLTDHVAAAGCQASAAGLGPAGLALACLLVQRRRRRRRA